MKRIGSAFCALLLAAALAEGGGGPLNTLVIVNDLSPRSLELGKIYQSARQIPDQNIFHISTTTNYNITTAAFSNEIRNPILSYIATSGLSNQIDYLAFMHDMPYRVYLGGSSNGLTSAIYFNFRTAQPPEALGWTNDYFVQERAFGHSGLPSSNRYYASALITGFTFEKATNLIARAALVSAVFSFTISLGEFGATSFLARPATPTLPVAIYRFLSQPGGLNYGQAMAMATLLLLVCALGILAIERLGGETI